MDLRELAQEFHPTIVQDQLRDIHRVTFQLGLVQARTGRAICDLGGGIGLFPVACAASGMRTVLIDDFRDPVSDTVPDAFQPHRRYGVEVIQRDLAGEGLPDFSRQFDVITCIDMIEHCHHSPRRFLKQAVAALKPGGAMVIGAPNALNLRKRIAWPLGMGRWTPLEEWYERPVFRSHVREPSVADLRYIARDLGLKDVRVYGRNWTGQSSPRAGIRALAKIMDAPLQAFPTLCSDLYLVGYAHA